jgi:ATP-binding cassette subfamily B protein
MQESISSILTLKAYGVEGKSTEKADDFAQIYYQKRMKRNALRAVMNVIFAFLSNFGLIFAVVWCSVSILYGRMTDYGSILSAILLLMQLQSPLSSFSSIPPAYYARIASGERLADIEDITTEVLEEDTTFDLYDGLKGISFENVAFSYGRESILTDMNATFDKGEIVCLTGPSGAGKSTIFKLLLQVYQPISGEITLHMQDGAKVLTAKERGLFAYVPQGNFLFSGTIYENLAFFSNEKDETLLKEKMLSALKTACADFVLDLPQGLDTHLAEGGAGLSEGQLQRLAVARALLSERPILLLDEATSALDADTEKRLIENIAGLKNKTCLLVTHRPKALEIADKILHIEYGQVVQK